MNKIILLISLMLFCSCATVKYVPVEARIDSVYVEKIVERLDTLFINIPDESREIVIKADSSHLETSVAFSDAWIDSLSILHHKLHNKPETALKKEVVYKDRIIEKEVVKEIPVIQEVKVPERYIPQYYKTINIIFWSVIAGIILALFLKIYLRH